MTDPNTVHTAVTTILPGWSALALRGADAARFAHAQLANDVASLPDASWQWNALLSAQGRVVALVLLLRVSGEELVLLAPHGRAADVATRLQRYVLRSRVQLVLETGWQAIGELGAGTGGALARGGTAVLHEGQWRIALNGWGARVLLAGEQSGAGAGTSRTALDAWQRADVRDAIPWIDAAVAEEFIPQALALDRLEAYSLSKGCYPGQEIVARTHYLGRSKRSLLRFRGPGSAPPAAGERLLQAGAEDQEASAIVLSAVAVGREIQGLAVARRELDPGVPLLTGVHRSPLSIEPFR